MSTEYRINRFIASDEQWNSIRDSVLSLERNAFGTVAATEDDLAADFLNPLNIIITIHEVSSKILTGFTHAKPIGEVFPERGDEKTAIIWNTIIDPKYRGNGLVAILMYHLQKVLREKGYEFIERYATTANNYAKNISKNYRGRIVVEEPYESELYGSQIFFRIKI